MKEKHTNIHVINIGQAVVCDQCNDDFTNSDESGGFLFGSHAYCPKCARESIDAIRGYGEEKYITARCPEGMSFKEFCLGLRQGDNTIQITSIEMRESDE